MTEAFRFGLANRAGAGGLSPARDMGQFSALVVPVTLLAIAVASCLSLAFLYIGGSIPAMLTAIGSFAAILGAGLMVAYKRTALDALPEGLDWQDAVSHSPDAYLITGPDGRYLYANRAYRRVAEAWSGSASLSPLDALDEGSRARELLADALREAIDKGAATVGFQAIGAADRGEVSVALHSVGDASGRVIWRLSPRSDEAQPQAGQALPFGSIIELLEESPLGFYVADADGRIRYVNGTLANWLGRQAGALAGEGMRLSELTDGGPGGVALEDAGPECGGRMDWRANDGAAVHTFVAQRQIELEDGSRFLRGAVLNLGDMDAHGASAPEIEARFAETLGATGVAVVRIDARSRIVWCNRAFDLMANLGPDSESQANLLDLIAPSDREDVAARLGRVMAGTASTTPIRARLATPDARPVELFAGELRISAESEPQFLLFFIDASRQEKLEAQFSQAQKMQAVGQLAGGIAHDFNNLLTAMIGFCDLLLLRHQVGDQSFADIMQIKQNANRAANLVRQLLAFSRQQTMQPKMISLTDVIAELSNLLRRLIGETIELHIEHGRDMSPVLVDQGQLEQVIINLAVNARDAMSDGGALTIRTSNFHGVDSSPTAQEVMPEGDYVLIEVSDSGHGIPREALDKVFVPFFTTKEIGVGTGLGLATVYGIIKQTGGFIFVESEVDVGTTVRLYLPRYQEPTAEHREEAAPEAEELEGDLTGAESILIVEDEAPVRVFAARALRNKGYEVIEAEDGEIALEILQGDRPIDLLITDIAMPNLDGPTLVARAREDRPTLRVILISGYAEDSFRKNLDELDDVDFMSKPFNLKQLAAKVKDALGSDDTD